jgi:hypothetical protein
MCHPIQTLSRSNLQVGCSIHPGRATRDGYLCVVRLSRAPPTVPRLCPWDGVSSD